jgi:transposase
VSAARRASPAPPSPRVDLGALQQMRASAQTLLRHGKVDETCELLLSALEALLVKNHELELLLAKLRRERIGRHSERLDPGQLALLFETLLTQGGELAPSDPDAEAREDAELDRAIADAEQAHADAPGQPTSRTRRRQAWQARDVERQVHEIELPPEDRACTTCRRQMEDIGVDTTHRLEYVPGHFIDHEYHDHKYACGRCRDGVTTAPAPPQVLERSAADASVLAHVIVSKYADHTPLHRLHRIYARSGAEIPVSTLADWTAGVAELAAPLVECLAARVLRADVVRTDATGLKVLDPQSAEHIELGSVWAYIGDDRDVLFRYTPTGEGATGPWTFLKGRTGYIQADASNVFDRLFNGEVARAIEVGCWSHGRRRLVAMRDTDCRVAYPLKLIARLYRVEHLADARGLMPEGRLALRQARSTSIVERLYQWAALTRQSEPPSSDLARAAGYLVNHHRALSRFLQDGRLSLDNNLCEAQLRDIALGRKNFLFAGSHQAAARAASLYSLTRTCAQYGVPPLEYFTEVLRTLSNGWSANRLEELLPHRWRDEHGEEITTRQ